jgi:methionine-rich copper-binding protein CopC
MKRTNWIILILFMLLLPAGWALAEDMPVIESRVVDVDGKPVAGAFIFFYDSPDTRRAVDLVSPVTDKNGYSVKEIPPGMYWALARLKKEGDFDMGPLMIGDKVSSDPIEIDVKHGDKLSLEFTVMNLLDTVNVNTKRLKGLNRITGRIVNEKGETVAGAFVFANRHDQPVTIPAYFSAWSDKQGRFAIYLPNGSYYLGSTKIFAPNLKYIADTAMTVDSDAENIEITLKTAGKE